MVVEGCPLILECTVVSVLPVTEDMVCWRYMSDSGNETTINGVSDFSDGDTFGMASLKIRKAAPSDQGIYQCAVRDSYGTEHRGSNIKVTVNSGKFV